MLIYFLLYFLVFTIVDSIEYWEDSHDPIGTDNIITKYYCSCNRSYNSKSALRFHRNVECGKEVTHCPKCPYTTKRKYALKKHLMNPSSCEQYAEKLASKMMRNKKNKK